MANCSALPGLSSLKIKSDETNLFCIKLGKSADISNYFTTFLQNLQLLTIILKNNIFLRIKKYLLYDNFIKIFFVV